MNYGYVRLGSDDGHVRHDWEVAKYYIRTKNDRSTIDKEIDEKLQKLDKLAELEQRVQTLEAIVTDPKESLKRDINGL